MQTYSDAFVASSSEVPEHIAGSNPEWIWGIYPSYQIPKMLTEGDAVWRVGRGRVYPMGHCIVESLSPNTLPHRAVYQKKKFSLSQPESLLQLHN